MGVLLLGAVVVAGLYFLVRPGPTFFDRWGAGGHPRRAPLGAPARCHAFGIAIRGGGRGRWPGSWRRCGATGPGPWRLLVGPVLAVAGCDWVVKPVVDRTFADVVSFPSGTVTAVAAVATVGLLATADRWRSVVATLGGTVTVLAIVSVVALRWHYPTDALAGVATGVGVVLLTDCAADDWGAAPARRCSGAATPAPMGRTPMIGTSVGGPGTRSDAERTARR